MRGRDRRWVGGRSAVLVVRRRYSLGDSAVQVYRERSGWTGNM